jgi:DEAD/DEAH box helicase domain-containing protein
MDTTAFINNLISRPEYCPQIEHIEHIPPRKAIFGKLDNTLPAELEESLKRNGLLPLYSHQATAINHIRKGSNVVVATSSASGKSLCYNVPVLEAVFTRSGSCALYLFPTKALAQDQLRKLIDNHCPDILHYKHVATFDGDTPQEERSEIRKHARIILTNPDMLHIGILPNHHSWSRFFRHLEYVVIDEAHSYRGVFGSHVGLVICRLRRLCRVYGSNPQFILSSATIDNPGEHGENLAGLSFQVVNKDGSPKGGKDFIFWNPATIDKARSIRRSSNSEAAGLFAELVNDGIRSLVFSRTRRLTELVASYARQKLAELGSAYVKRVKAYRAGYLSEDRRQIEQELADGRLTGVSATNALELGIDIGDLEATVLSGYPGTIASTWQQAGRSGRRECTSLSILVALNNPLDQYFMRHPDYFFSKSFENALVNTHNPYILKAHLLCAAWESPLSEADTSFFGSIDSAITELEEQFLLRHRGVHWHLSPSVLYPAQDINIRTTSGENVTLIDTSTHKPLETVDVNYALFQLHPGAVYLHQGETYIVSELDLRSQTAYAESKQVSYYTVANDFTDLHILNTSESRKFGDVEVYLGQVEVTINIFSYKKKVQFTDEVIGEEPLDLPQQQFPTVALWFDIPPSIIDNIIRQDRDFTGGLHAAEHAAIAILPLFAMCDRNDIGGVSTPCHPDSGRAQIFIYDGYPGGIGIAEKGYQLIEQLWEATLRLVTDCPCLEGCPGCIQSPKCGDNNKPLDKEAALFLLEEIFKRRTGIKR